MIRAALGTISLWEIPVLLVVIPFIGLIRGVSLLRIVHVERIDDCGVSALDVGVLSAQL